MPQRHVVLIQSNRFAPSVLHLNVGDEVVWDNRDGHAHTATSSMGATLFDTGDIPGHAQSKAIIFDHGSEPSGFEYYCTYHDFMSGRLFVLPAGFRLAVTTSAIPIVPPTYSPDQWRVIARIVAAHWVLDMTDNFVYAMTVHRDNDLGHIKTEWDALETWWQQKTNSSAKIIDDSGKVNTTAFMDRSRDEIEALGKRVRLAHVKLRPLVFRYPAPIRPDAILHAGELYEGQSNDPFGEAITVNFVGKPIQDAEVRHESYAGALLSVEIAVDSGQQPTDGEKAAYRAARQSLQIGDFHLLAAHMYRGLSQLFASPDFVEAQFVEGIRRMTNRGEWDGSVFPLWHWLRWIDGYLTVLSTGALPDPAGLANP